MSMTWNATVTNQGIQLQTKQVQGSTLTFTRAVSGSGTVPVVNLKEQTAVSNIQQTLNIQTVTMGVMQYVMNILLTNTNLQTGYNLSQIGLYATDPDVGEILFAIAQLDTPKEIPSYAESPGYNMEMAMTFANTQGANVTITPDLAGYVTVGAAQAMIENAVDPVNNPTFTEAESRTNIASEESLSTLFGKIKKWFSDLTTVAFTGEYDDLSGQPTIGNGTLTIKKNGTYLQTFTANQIADAEVDIECVDTVDSSMSDSSTNPLQNKVITKELEGAQTVTGSIVTVQDAAPINAVDVSVDLEPIQDLHGYDSPWVGGAGKNLLYADKAKNLVDHGITFTVNSDGTIRAQGTATATAGLTLASFRTFPLVGTPLKFTCVPVGGGYSTFRAHIWGYDGNKSHYAVDTGNGVTFTFTDLSLIPNCAIIISSGQTVDMVFKPMICTDTDATYDDYEPYENICPISGRTEENIVRVGVNQWDEEWELGALNGITGADYPSSNSIRSKGYIKVQPNTMYYGIIPTSNFNVYQYNKNHEFLGSSSSASGVSNSVFTTNNNAHYIRLEINSGYGTTYNHDISINYPSTDTDYHAYQGKTYTIQLGQEVYGGRLDVTRGKLVVDKKLYDLGTFNYGILNNVFYTGSSSDKKPGTTNVISSQYRTIDVSTEAEMPDGSIRGRFDSVIFIRDDRYTTATDFKAAMSGVQVCYEIKNPFTIDLTPTQIKMLENTNTLYTDTGDISLEYQPNNAIGEAVRIAEENCENSNKVRITTLPYRWTAGTGASYQLTSVAYGNGRFVAVADGAPTTFYSKDGQTWTAGSTISEEPQFKGVAYGKGKFVAVGSYGAIFYSTDGQTWTAGIGVSSVSSYDAFWGVAYGNGRFVAVGSYLTYYSDDGINWTPGSENSKRFNGVGYGNGRFVAVGQATSTAITYYSEDGINWTAGSTPGISGSALSGVAYGNGMFVAVGYNNNSGEAYYSTDGINWTAGTGVIDQLYSVAFANGLFVAVGNHGLTLYSEDGINWTAVEIGEDVILGGVTYGNGRFVAVGSSGKTFYFDSISQIMTLPELSNLLNPLTILPEVTKDIDYRLEGNACRNVLPTTLNGIKQINTEGTWSGDAYTYNGVTYTVNTDSNGNVTSISTSGTSSDASFLRISRGFNKLIAINNYMSGCPSGGSQNSYYLELQIIQNPYTVYATDYGNGTQIGNIESDVPLQVYIYTTRNVNMNGKTFYPMISRNPNATYEPYYPSNKELAATRPELKSVEISGTTNASGELDLYRSSNYRLIPICVFTNKRHYVKLGSLTNQFGNVIYSRWTTMDPGSGSELILENVAVSGTLYYYEI